MSNSSTSNSNKLQMLIRSVLFLVGLVISYILIVLIMSSIPVKPNSLFRVVIGNLAATGKNGQTLRRFREVETVDDIDLLFVGSSHSYRSLDPKIFSKLGLTSIHLGSRSQTPLSSYFLLKKYYKRLNPKMVIFELYPTILQLEGLEGFYDLAANLELDEYIFQMSKAINHMHGYNSLAERYLNSFFRSLTSYVQSPIANEHYESGGFLHAEIIYPGDYFGPTGDIIIAETQLEYLKETINYIKENKGKLLIVIAPLPIERVKAITNYKEVVGTINAITKENDILFYDFNKSLTLNTRTDFRDHQHLNANGAKIFSYALLDSLLDVSELNQTFDIKPSFATKIYAGRGITLLSQNKIEQAEIDLQKALDIDENNIKALINLGLVYSIQENFHRAIDCFDKALTLDAHSFDAFYNKATILEKIGENKKAIEMYQQSLVYLPSDFANYKQGIIQKINSLK